jgi:hypothetical protein
MFVSRRETDRVGTQVHAPGIDLRCLMLNFVDPSKVIADVTYTAVSQEGRLHIYGCRSAVPRRYAPFKRDEKQVLSAAARHLTIGLSAVCRY